MYRKDKTKKLKDKKPIFKQIMKWTLASWNGWNGQNKKAKFEKEETSTKEETSMVKNSWFDW